MCSNFEIWGQSILEVIQAFHTVRIVVYILCSGPVVECLKISIWNIQWPYHWARTPDIQNYAYSMKSLSNFQNALASVFEVFSHLSTVILHFSWSKHKFQNISRSFFHPLFQEKITFISKGGLLVTIANSSDPDQAQHNVWPDLDPNSLTLWSNPRKKPF